MKEILKLALIAIIAILLLLFLAENIGAQEKESLPVPCGNFVVDGSAHEWDDQYRVAKVYKDAQAWNYVMGWYYQRQCGVYLHQAIVYEPGYILTYRYICGSHGVRLNGNKIIENCDHLTPGTPFEFFRLPLGTEGWESRTQTPSGSYVAYTTFQTPNNPPHYASTFEVPTAAKLIFFGVK